MGQNNPPAYVAKNPSGISVPLQVDAEGNLYVVLNSPEPEDATPVNASSGNVAAGVAAATMPAVTGKTNYVSGFDLTAAGATAALVVQATLTGVVGGPLTYIFVFPAGVTLSATPLHVAFNPPLPASAVDTAIAISLPSGGTGNTNASASIYGFVK